MPKSENQKGKLLYLIELFQQETDKEHKLTTQDILEKLSRKGITAERRTFYRDLADLRSYGIEIESEQIGKNHYYYLDKREFELAELKMLVDSVQASRFLTMRRTKQLIKKLEKLTSRHQAKQLHRQVHLSEQLKSTNDGVFDNVDRIHTAISTNRQIKFRYFQWNEKKKRVLRHNGRWYHVSPWALVVNEQNYYLLAYDTDAAMMKTFRVDKMLNMELQEFARIGREEFEKINLSEYTKQVFGMFTGKGANVTLEVANELAGVIIDRFGQECMLIPISETHFSVSVEVSVSERFYGWLIGFGEKIEVKDPKWVREEIGNHLRKTLDLYQT